MRVIVLPKLNALRELADEVLEELDAYEKSIAQHRQKCACEESKISMEILPDYKFGVSEMIKRMNAANDKAHRAIAVANGDKTQLS